LRNGITMIQNLLPGATIAIDRFHVAHQYRNAIDDLCKQERRGLQKVLTKAAHSYQSPSTSG
jgi:hypothetical protein